MKIRGSLSLPLGIINAAGDVRQGESMISRLHFIALMVVLVLPQPSPFAPGPIVPNPTSFSAISPGTIAHPPDAAGDCLPTPASIPIVYYGVYVPGWLDTMDAVTTFENHAKKKVSIVMLYQGWGVPDRSRFFQKAWMDNIRNHGSIPMVTWEPWLYTAGVSQPKFQLANIINGTFDPYIQKWADDSKAWGHPYFLRFAAEMNGNWFPWSEK